MMDRPSLDWSQVGQIITGAGALGVAAFGVTEALGKALAFRAPDGEFVFGLPYLGWGSVRHMMEPLQPALRVAYGDGFKKVIAEQYRADRGDGRAPDTIRQGVRLGLPFLAQAEAAKVIAACWHMDLSHANALAAALRYDAGDTSPPPKASSAEGGGAAADPMQALAGRFATALDARVNAAFALADERYEAVLKLVSGFVAILLSVVFDWTLEKGAHMVAAAFIGLVAVPLAPVAKDLSTKLQDALTAFKSIPLKRV